MAVAQSNRTPIDPEAMESILGLGDGALRAALKAQLRADFLRLRSAIAVEDEGAAARAAHELKGLAATVGAARLADLARNLDPAAGSLPPAVRQALVGPAQRETDAVLAVLDGLDGGVAAP